MKRYFCQYELWEDFNSGLYKDKIINKEKRMIDLAKLLLSNQRDFYLSALKMIHSWKVSAKINLTNLSRNRRAWVDQATCCFKYGIPENITKHSWNQLDKKTQIKANAIADNVIKLWEEEYNAKN